MVDKDDDVELPDNDVDSGFSVEEDLEIEDDEDSSDDELEDDSSDVTELDE